MKSSTSAAPEIVQLPRSSGATHSWIPYRSGAWLQARRPRQEDVFSESEKSAREQKSNSAEPLPLEGLSPCKVGWHRRADFACHLVMGEGVAGNSQEVPHSLAGGRSTNFLPFPLSPEPTKAEIQLSMVGARGKPVSPELFHGAARMFESDATRLSSSRGTVCCALNNAFAQRGVAVVCTTQRSRPFPN